jgi:mutator protein MutT
MTLVAIALVSHRGCYLVGQRGPDGPLAGFAEFPGGKCLPGEPPEACAVRECLEETGLPVRVVRLRQQIDHTYPYGAVQLNFFDCVLVPGVLPDVLRPNFFWVPRDQLREYQFPEPNHQLIAELADSDVH